MPFDIHGAKGSPDLRSFLFEWAARVADALNAQLPAQSFRAALACRTRAKTAEALRASGEGPPPHASVSARFADHMAVNLVDAHDGHTAASVVFVDEDHKADSDGGLVLAVRVAALASAGAGVVVVDVAPGPAGWATHLHTLVPVYPIAKRPRGGAASVLVIHPRVRGDAEQYDVWHHPVPVGNPFPIVPLPCGSAHVMLDLEATYASANDRTP